MEVQCLQTEHTVQCDNRYLQSCKQAVYNLKLNTMLALLLVMHATVHTATTLTGMHRIYNDDFDPSNI